jgi:hypothetical protein
MEPTEEDEELGEQGEGNDEPVGVHGKDSLREEAEKSLRSPPNGAADDLSYSKGKQLVIPPVLRERQRPK